ncbi:hypothetical protein KW782_04020 [Candidatus Parcubacteria bacterium]|nr:hypothetical protein [Candidatus Parcubacteria bacterium]
MNAAPDTSESNSLEQQAIVPERLPTIDATQLDRFLEETTQQARDEVTQVEHQVATFKGFILEKESGPKYAAQIDDQGNIFINGMHHAYSGFETDVRGILGMKDLAQGLDSQNVVVEEASVQEAPPVPPPAPEIPPAPQSQEDIPVTPEPYEMAPLTPEPAPEAHSPLSMSPEDIEKARQDIFDAQEAVLDAMEQQPLVSPEVSSPTPEPMPAVPPSPEAISIPVVEPIQEEFLPKDLLDAFAKRKQAPAPELIPQGPPPLPENIPHSSETVQSEWLVEAKSLRLPQTGTATMENAEADVRAAPVEREVPLPERLDPAIIAEIASIMAPDNRTTFQKLADGTKNFLWDKLIVPPVMVSEALGTAVAHKALTTLDGVKQIMTSPGRKIGMLFNGFLVNREQTGTLRAKGSVLERQRTVDKYTYQINAIDAAVATLKAQQKEFERTMALSPAQKLDYDLKLQNLETQKKEIGEKRQSAQSGFEIASERAVGFEKTKQTYAEELFRRVNPKLEPFNTRCESLKQRKDFLNSSRNKFREILDQKRQELAAMDGQIQRMPLLKDAFDTPRQIIVTAMARAQEKYESSVTEYNKIMTSINRLDERRKGWKDMSDAYSRKAGLTT